MISVAHFCGRMFASGRPEEAGIRAEVDAVLAEDGVVAGFGALACGADILVAEALLARAARLVVILPFSVDRFEVTSVRIGGAGWVPRYRACLAQASDTQILEAEGERPYAEASAVAMRAVLKEAKATGGEALQIALFDGVEDARGVGTTGDIAEWRGLGGTSRTVRIPAELRLRQR